jgi:hypothetical protein
MDPVSWEQDARARYEARLRTEGASVKDTEASTVRTRIGSVLLLVVLAASAARAAPDITGKWTASFDTQIGRQDYTFEFQLKGSTLKGRVSSANGETDIQNGKVAGDTVTFLETLRYQGMTIPITYTGTIVSADEIRFSRQVGEFATEELVARRAK